ncbi:hypothetical protein VOLCADRAFT_95771 [Volvox carteri f. nagariensis]|uniref:Guanylate cyclase domain-containing protein n=1 Tax=Volvox carteri f. nagariensis TaxID=3068 RepID=D8U8C3_VOLCA|nr:uncharacterized protein VOLCADRAFT_95771 [Volvox carteri f. nagariensis]EFJ44112.1 hypothetical protein VOLCADRAFT_95771 [Volvox carteri f. nagariensis]|eukprot:XP_002954913.1 hypothetical protein VOLCADRAFT_95771 [Volvox carteri f. nagariensis]
MVCATLFLVLVLGWTCTVKSAISDNETDTLYMKCPQIIASSIDSSCVAGNLTSRSRQSLKQDIVKGWYQCWSTINEGDPEWGPALRVLLPDIYEDWLRPTLLRFSEASGVPLDLNVQPMDRLLDTITNDVNLHPSRQHAVWLQTTLTTQHLADVGMSLDLSHLVDSVSSIRWSDIYQLFRLQLASYKGQIVSMPLDGSTMYLINRRDVFDRLKLEVPRTWEELLQYVEDYQRARDAALAAEAASTAASGAAAGGLDSGSSSSSSSSNTTAASGAGALPPYPICLPRGAACRRLTLLQAIWSTIAQTHGSQQGVHFDPTDLRPLLDTPAAAEAFRITGKLLAASAPSEPDEGCTHGSLGFARGRCALVLAVYVQQMRMFIREEFKSTVEMSRLSVWPVPGSHRVWVRGSGSGSGSSSGGGSLELCTKELCPQASLYSLQGGRTPAGQEEGGPGAPSQMMLVNHAPLSPGSNLAVAINGGMPLAVQYIGFELLAYLASLDRYDKDEPEPLLQTMAPVREHFVATDAVGKWVEAGYDSDVMAAAMAPIAFTRQHPNRAWDLRMPYHMTYNALRSGQARLAAYYTREIYLEKYLASLAMTTNPSSPPIDPGSGGAAPAPRPGGSGGGVRAATLVPALVVSTLAVGALAGGGAWAVLWRRRRQRSRGGVWEWKRRHKEGSREPVALVVTDIQDSTVLWEALPAAVMSDAVRLHHGCIRRLLVAHGGYESATEGDSFILAFLTVKQAVAFAMDLQARVRHGVSRQTVP